MIDLTQLDRVAVDPGKRSARVQGGALLGPLDRATQPYRTRRRAAHVLQSGPRRGGTPFLPPVNGHVPLDLIETRTFGARVIYERDTRARDDMEFACGADAPLVLLLGDERRQW